MSLSSEMVGTYSWWLVIVTLVVTFGFFALNFRRWWGLSNHNFAQKYMQFEWWAQSHLVGTLLLKKLELFALSGDGDEKNGKTLGASPHALVLKLSESDTHSTTKLIDMLDDHHPHICHWPLRGCALSMYLSVATTSYQTTCTFSLRISSIKAPNTSVNKDQHTHLVFTIQNKPSLTLTYT